jgi:hypothetical protein
MWSWERRGLRVYAENIEGYCGMAVETLEAQQAIGLHLSSILSWGQV